MDWNKIEQHINDNFKEIKPDDEHLIIIPDLPLFLIKTTPNEEIKYKVVDAKPIKKQSFTIEPTYTVFPISPAGQLLGGMRFPTKERVVEYMLETSKRALSIPLYIKREVEAFESIAKSLRAPTERLDMMNQAQIAKIGKQIIENPFGVEFSNGFNFDELPSNEEMREKINQAKLDKQELRTPDQHPALPYHAFSMTTRTRDFTFTMMIP